MLYEFFIEHSKSIMLSLLFSVTNGFTQMFSIKYNIRHATTYTYISGVL